MPEAFSPEDQPLMWSCISLTALPWAPPVPGGRVVSAAPPAPPGKPLPIFASLDCPRSARPPRALQLCPSAPLEPPRFNSVLASLRQRVLPRVGFGEDGKDVSPGACSG